MPNKMRTNDKSNNSEFLKSRNDNSTNFFCSSNNKIKTQSVPKNENKLEEKKRDNKKSKSASRIITTFASMVSVLFIGVAVDNALPASTINANIDKVCAGDHIIEYCISVDDFKDDSELFVVLYNDFTNRTQKIEDQLFCGAFKNLQNDMTYTLAVKQGSKFIIKKQVKTKKQEEYENNEIPIDENNEIAVDENNEIPIDENNEIAVDDSNDFPIDGNDDFAIEEDIKPNEDMLPEENIGDRPIADDSSPGDDMSAVELEPGVDEPIAEPVEKPNEEDSFKEDKYLDGVNNEDINLSDKEEGAQTEQTQEEQSQQEQSQYIEDEIDEQIPNFADENNAEEDFSAEDGLDKINYPKG